MEAQDLLFHLQSIHTQPLMVALTPGDLFWVCSVTAAFGCSHVNTRILLILSSFISMEMTKIKNKGC